MNKEEKLNDNRDSQRAAKRPKIKSVAILNVAQHPPSPHILNLKQTRHSKSVSATLNVWKPNSFHQLLSHPITSLKQSVRLPAAYSPVPIFRDKQQLRHLARFFNGFLCQIQNDARLLEKKIKQAIFLPFRPFTRGLRAISNTAKIFSAKTRQNSANFRARAATLPEYFLASVKPKKSVLNNVWLKTAAAFAGTALMFIIPVKAFSAYSLLKESKITIQTQSANGFQSLQASGSALLAVSNDQAVEEIQNALNTFSQINNELAEIGPITRTLLRLSPARYAQFETGSNILRAGELISQALLPITASLSESKNSTNSLSTDRLLSFQKAVQTALPRVSLANLKLRGINSDILPTNNREQFQILREYLRDLENDLHSAEELFGLLYEMMGGTTDKRYLVVLQNNTEMRATGGFIGSFALLDLSRGEIKQIRFPNGGSYDLQGGLKVALEPPAPLKILRTRWEFQDANWFPDFPASARKLAWFYEKSGGATVDGVVALDTHILIDLLKLTGPLNIPVFNKTISADNAIPTIQTEVEINYDRQINEPKRFLGAVIEEMAKKLKTNPTDVLATLAILQNNLAERHIQLMSFHEAEQQSVLRHDWGGALKTNPEGDFLAVINSNIGGQKTDGVIEQKTRLQTAVQGDGSIINTLTIERKHKGAPGTLFYGVPNIDFVRVLVPEGSTLINTTGFSYPEENLIKIADEHYAADTDLARAETHQTTDEASGTIINAQFGKTAFANWIITKPGEISLASITYRLPFNAFATSKKSLLENFSAWLENDDAPVVRYSLLVQKQAGMENNNFAQQLIFPAATKIIWTTPADWKNTTDSSYEIEIKSAEDIFNGFVGRVIKF